MNKTELIKAVADRTGETQTKVKDILDEVLGVIKETVADDEDVALMGFGTFKLKHNAARAGFDPIKKKKTTIAASKTPKFTAGADFKQSCR